ncbi:Gfo/Idh/MocA family protein [Halosimplex sp. J119]
MSTDPYRVGVIGCGGMGEAHARAFRKHGRTEVVAAAEPNEEARQAFATEYDVGETFETYETMLDAVDLDLVSVCTWHSTHARMTIDVAESGVDGVFCEKPMCTSLGEAEAMLDAADRNDTVLTVGHQRRYDPIHEKARELVADGEIGDPVTVAAGYRDGLLNWGTHFVDLTRYVLGDPTTEWVMGQFERETDRYERGVPIEDRCLGQICFESGTRFTLEMDLPEPGESGREIHVHGTEGSLTLTLGTEVAVRNGDGVSTYAPERETSSRYEYLDEMIELMDGEREDHRCSGWQARHTIEILMAIYESARTNGLVETPLQTRANPLEAMRENGELEPEHPGEYDIRIPYRGVDEL